LIYLDHIIFAIISVSKTISPRFHILYPVWDPYSTILFHQILFSNMNQYRHDALKIEYASDMLSYIGGMVPFSDEAVDNCLICQVSCI